MKKMFADELKSNSSYQQILEDTKLLREKKKSIENDMKAQSLKDAQKLDDLRIDIMSDKELLADLALNMYLANETVEIVDEESRRWVPHFSVTFKKD